MFKIVIHTEQKSLGLMLVEQINVQIDIAEVQLIVERTWAYEITYAYDCLRSHLKTLSEIIFPFKPNRRLNETLSSQECHVYLGSSRHLNEFKVQIKTDSQVLRSQLVDSISPYFKTQSRISSPTHSVLKFGGAPPFINDFIHWLGYQETQVPVNLEKVWGDDENDLHLFIQDPTLRGIQFRKNLGLYIFTDEAIDPVNEDDSSSDSLGLIVEEQFKTHGYQPRLEIMSSELWPAESKEYGFIINPIGFSIDINEAQKLIDCVQSSIEDYGIVSDYYPVQIYSFTDSSFSDLYVTEQSLSDSKGEGSKQLYVCIYLPYHQVIKQSIYPISGNSKLRWALNLYGNQGHSDHDMQGELVQAINEQGFSRTNPYAHSGLQEVMPQGAIYIDWGSAESYPLIKNSIMHAILGRNSFNPPIVENRSDQNRNTIEIIYFQDDFRAELWNETLHQACRSLSLSIILNSTELYDGLEDIIDLSWQDTEHQSYFEYMNATQSENPDGSSYDQLSDDWSSSDGSEDWDQSELQDWLMSSLHDQDDYDRPELCIIYGGSPLFVIAWLREKLESLFDVEVEVQEALNEDDFEIIVEFSPQFNPSMSSLEYSSDESIHSLSEQTLIAPPSTGQNSRANKLNQMSSDTQQVKQFNHGKTSLESELTQVPRFIFYPYFESICGHLMRAVDTRESMIISGPPSVGISTAFMWCKQQVDALLITPDNLDADSSLPLTIVHDMRTRNIHTPRVILIDRFDLFPNEIQLLLNQTFEDLKDDLKGQKTQAVMIVSVNESHDQDSFSDLGHFKSFKLPKPKAQDWEELLVTLFESEKSKFDSIDDQQVQRLIKNLSIIQYQAQTLILEQEIDQRIEPFLGFLGVKRMIGCLKNFLISLESNPSKYTLLDLVKSIYPPALIGELYTKFNFDELH